MKKMFERSKIVISGRINIDIGRNDNLGQKFI